MGVTELISRQDDLLGGTCCAIFKHPAATEYEGDKGKMGIIVAYTLLALVFLALSSGLFKPKRWRDLSDRHVKILKIGCFFGFLVIMVNIVGKFL